MNRVVRLLLVLLVLPALVWGQTSVVNGNRVQAGWLNYGTTAGTATAYTLTFTPALPGYVPGQCFLLKPHITNTGAATLNVQSKGALALTKLSGGSVVPVEANDLLLGRLVQVCHDGTGLQLMGAVADATGTGVTDGDKGDITVSSTGTNWQIDPGAVTYTEIQNVTTARVLGRTTAGAGPLEELTAAQVKTMLGITFGDITGTVSDAQLGPVNTYNTTLTPSRCVETDSNGALVSASGLCGTTGGTGVSDGDKGDITVSVGGTTWTIDPNTVLFSKMQNIATTRLLGRQAAGTGSIEELTAAQAKNLLAIPVTPEDVTNKSQTTSLGTSPDLYPSQNAVKVYVDTGLAAKENASNKSASANLSTSNDFFPTQGAVKAYVDNTAKTMTNTEVVPRLCTGGPGSPVAINANACDTVHVAELNGATTFSIPTFTTTPANGQFLSISIFTTTARTLTFPTGANGWSAENGLALPTTTVAGGYVLYGFRWNSLSTRWAFVATTQASGGGGTGYVHLPVSSVHLPTVDPARLDGSENNRRLLFDNNTRQCAWWGPFRMNPDYASTPVFKWQYSMTSAVTLGVSIDVQVMAVAAGETVDVDSEANYDVVNNCDDTPVPATSGGFKEISCPLTNNDTLAARKLTKVKICRAVADGVDQAAGFMEGLAAGIEYSR